MKKWIGCTLLPLLLASCAVGPGSDNSPLLWRYQQYHAVVSAQTTQPQQLDDFFTSERLKQAQQKTDDTVTLLFGRQVARVLNHYEKITGNEGCLVINGFQQNDKPVVQSLRYAHIKGEWRIVESKTFLLSDTNNFARQAKCPDAFGALYLFGGA